MKESVHCVIYESKLLLGSPTFGRYLFFEFFIIICKIDIWRMEFFRTQRLSQIAFWMGWVLLSEVCKAFSQNTDNWCSHFLPSLNISIAQKQRLLPTILFMSYVNTFYKVNLSHILFFRHILESVLPHFARALKNQPINSTVLNLIIYNVVRYIDDFAEPSHCILLCDQFLFVWLQYEEVLHHVLRMLWCVHEKIDSPQLVRLLTATQPSSHVSIKIFIFLVE